jgi:hypothetical protein
MQLAARPRITVGAKQVATQHWITAGVAVAGLIAVAPGVTPVLPHLQHELQASAVRLTAGWDPLTAWQNAFNTTSANASTLADNFLLAPGVGLQQAIVNEVGFLKEVLNDPSSIGTVLTQIANNAQTVASGLTGVNVSAATAKAANAHSVDTLHGLLASTLPTMLPPGTDVATVTQVLNVLESPLSGLLIGAVGPVISPGVALLNTVLAVGAALQASNPSAALSDLLDAPANAVNAFFNGADLNLDALVPLIAKAGILPASTTINALDVAFGGLLSVGSVSQGTYTQNGTITPITTPGGSILNSVGLNISTVLGTTPITLNIPSQAVGPLGALESISQTVGVLLGDHWDGKKAVQVAPLSTLSDTAAAPAAVNAALTVKAPTTASVTALPSAAATVALTTAPATKAIEAAAPAAAKDATDTSAAAKDATDTSAAAKAAGATTGATDVTNGNKVVPGTTGTGATKSGDAPLGTVSDGIKAADANVGEGTTKAVSNDTGKSSASAGSSSGTGKHSASAGSSKGSGGGGRHRK